MDFFLWGHVKHSVYSTKPATIDELRAAIERECTQIPIEMIRNVLDSIAYWKTFMSIWMSYLIRGMHITSHPSITINNAEVSLLLLLLLLLQLVTIRNLHAANAENCILDTLTKVNFNRDFTSKSPKIYTLTLTFSPVEFCYVGSNIRSLRTKRKRRVKEFCGKCKDLPFFYSEILRKLARSLPSKETLRGHSDSSFRGEGYIQCCVGVRLCDMYSNQELAEIHFMYGKADGSAALARRLYQERYPQRQCPDRKTFVRLHYRLCEYGKFNSPALGRGRPRSTTPEVQGRFWRL
ncbi:hypothetical protein ANN_08480 [Periplaneta americana]|uniref:DUF4817 domain-containing protein n=1 Tax=Periplaneta americana TaxID=6978 RepID=A0ABQ8T2X5_PERAM|nr:hypothetical protein ANN_08480 [Periplaneta americana]